MAGWARSRPGPAASSQVGEDFRKFKKKKNFSENVFTWFRERLRGPERHQGRIGGLLAAVGSRYTLETNILTLVNGHKVLICTGFDKFSRSCEAEAGATSIEPGIETK